MLENKELKAKIAELKAKVKEVEQLADEVVQLASAPPDDDDSGDPGD